MRKQIMGQNPKAAADREQAWLDVEPLAQVEVTSEDAAHPVEAALALGREVGWRAAQPGEQTIRLMFDQPQRLKRIRLVFEERDRARTQEFLLRWSPDGGQSWQEIVRQQWNFSPSGAIEEIEDYRVEFSGVTALELKIQPDQSGGEARASLAQLRLA